MGRGGQNNMLYGAAPRSTDKDPVLSESPSSPDSPEASSDTSPLYPLYFQEVRLTHTPATDIKVALREGVVRSTTESNSLTIDTISDAKDWNWIVARKEKLTPLMRYRRALKKATTRIDYTELRDHNQLEDLLTRKEAHLSQLFLQEKANLPCVHFSPMENDVQEDPSNQRLVAHWKRNASDTLHGTCPALTTKPEQFVSRKDLDMVCELAKDAKDHSVDWRFLNDDYLIATTISVSLSGYFDDLKQGTPIEVVGAVRLRDKDDF